METSEAAFALNMINVFIAPHKSSVFTWKGSLGSQCDQIKT